MTALVAAGPVLAARGLRKAFPGVLALDDVALALRGGEIHALMGENGAGKSTLIKVLAGVHGPDAGAIEIDGRPVVAESPRGAERLGISTVFQEINLLPNLSVAENIVLGRGAGRLVRWSAMRARAIRALGRLGHELDVDAPLGGLAIATQQLVAIARALDVEARVLVLDEPTSSLDAREVAALFDVLRRLRAQGLAILFVTHFLEQAYALCDRITVLRNGRRVGEWLVAELPRLQLVAHMLGRALAAATGEAAPRSALAHETAADSARERDGTQPILSARGLARRGGVGPLDFDLHAGSVVGLAGLLGSGRTETARLLFGLDRGDAGELQVDGRPVRLRSPAHAIALGLGFCGEDRRRDGIVPGLSVRQNLVLALQARRGVGRRVTAAEAAALAERFVQALRIRAADLEAPIALLSGGNQQKVLLARWLAIDPRVLILDEPTRGIDVGARADIEALVARLRADGLAVLLASSELEELVRTCDELIVLRDRRQVGRLAGATDVDAILHCIAGAEAPAAAAAPGPDPAAAIEPPVATGTEPPVPPPPRRAARVPPWLWAAVGLLLLLAVDALAAPGFFRLEVRDGRLYGTLVDILDQGARVVLLAIGMTLVVATGGVDLSVGSLMALSGAVAATLVVQAQAPFALAIGAAALVAMLLGAGNGLLVARGVQPLIATLVLMVAGRGLALWVTGGQVVTFEDEAFTFLGNGHLGGVPVSLMVVAGVLALAIAATRGSGLGLFLAATGDNARASHAAGVPTVRVQALAYALSGLCACLAGLLAAGSIKAADAARTGEGAELDAVFAVVVGGTALTGGRFTLVGSVLGALLIQTLTTTMYNLGVSPAVNAIPKALAIVAVCLLQSPRVRGWLLRRGGRS